MPSRAKPVRRTRIAASSRSPTELLTSRIRGALAEELLSLGIRTVNELKKKGWKSAFVALTQANPKRRNLSTALSIYACCCDKRPIDVGESMLDRIGVFVRVQQATAMAKSGGLPTAEVLTAMLDAEARSARRHWVKLGDSMPILWHIRSDIGQTLLQLGVCTVGDLRRLGWQRVVEAFVATQPRRGARTTARAIYATEQGLRPKDVSCIPDADQAIARLVERIGTAAPPRPLRAKQRA